METLTIETKRTEVVEGKKEITLPFYGVKQDGTYYMVNTDGIVTTVKFDISEKRFKHVSIINYYNPQVIIADTDEEIHMGKFFERYEAAIHFLHKLTNANI